MQVRLPAFVEKVAAQVIAWRRHLHAHPELSFAEHETTRYITAQLTAMGLSPQHPTPTGAVVVIEGNRPGRTVAVRADIDALPIQEENTCSYVSQRPGVMHACGHDGHAAILLGLARVLSDNRDFAGRVKLLFQPAEELPPGGALSLIAAGALADVDAVFGLHLIANVPVGQAAIRPGPMMACADAFTVTVRGKGGHGSAPHETVDSIVVAAQVVLALQTVVSRRLKPGRAAVVTVGMVQGGSAFNIVAPATELKGTVRCLEPALRQVIKDEMERIISHTCAAAGAGYSFAYHDGYPSVVNEPAMTTLMAGAAAQVLGRGQVHEQEPVMGGEDFAYYLQQRPGAFLFLGSGNPDKGADAPHHSPQFDIDEDSLAYGVAILHQTVNDYLRG